ncbi:YoaK family protein [Shinella sp. M27]|uniref:YoaK family protein n=1 Tax=Shinella sp. M27 TaxID=3368614 RepID=UPI003B9DD30F
MLIHEGDTRTHAIDVMLASILSLVAGSVNSAGFMAYHFFSANMTGNISMASELLAVSQFDVALSFLTIVVMFIFGAFAASVFIEVGKRRQHRNIYALTLIVEAAILVLVGLSSVGTTAISNGTVLVGLLSFTMGIQNAASTRISGSRVRTTHVSGVATDIGVGLAMLASGEANEKAAVLRRLSLHLATVAAFAIGGVFGVIGYQHFGSATFALLAAPLIALSTLYLR